MNPLVLSLLLLQTPAPSHAELHPQDTDLFFQASNIAAAIEAYRSAPIVQMLSDDRIAPLAAQLGFDVTTMSETPVRDAVVGVLGSIAGAENAAPILDALSTVSFSVSRSNEADGRATAKSHGLLLVIDAANDDAAAALAEVILVRASDVTETESRLRETVTFQLTPITVPLWMAREDARIFIGGGAVGPDDVAALRADSSTSFLEHAATKRACASFTEPSGAVLFWLYQTQSALNLALGLDEDLSLFGGRLLPLKWAASLPVDPLAGERMLRMQLNGAEFVTEGFVPESAEGRQALDDACLASVPDGAMIGWASNATRDLARAIQQGMMSAGASAQEITDFEAIASALGPRVQGFAFPISGIGLPKMYAWLDLVSDPAQFQERVTGLVERLQPSFPGLESRTRDYRVRNRTTDEKRSFSMTILTIPKELLNLGPYVSISPTFALVDDRLLLGMRSSDVKSELKRLFSGRATTTQDPNGLFATRGKESAGASTVIVIDWNAQVRAALNLVKTFAPLFVDLPFDLNALPTGDAFTSFFKPTVHTTRAVDGGSYSRHVASFGPGTWLGAARAAMVYFGDAPAGDTRTPGEPGSQRDAPTAR